MLSNFSRAQTSKSRGLQSTRVLGPIVSLCVQTFSVQAFRVQTSKRPIAQS